MDVTIPQIAMVIAYFTPEGKGFPNYFEYWQKSAAANIKIDFFIATNVDTSNYVKYDNIHFLHMSSDFFWDKIQQLLGCEIVKDFYKIAELKPLYGILFQEILQNYDYWGYGDIDLIYGDIAKLLQKCFAEGKEAIGSFGHFCLVKNTDKIRYLPLQSVECIEHPLNIKNIATEKPCCYWDEFRGMGLRLYQAGIDVVRLQSKLADIDQKYKYFSVLGRNGKWGFTWKNGTLTGYNNRNEKMEFLYVHFQKRRLSVPHGKAADKFCIVPNEILNDCECSDHINVNSVVYTLVNRFKYYRKSSIESKELSPELKMAFEETSKYCFEHGLMPNSTETNVFQKVKSLF